MNNLINNALKFTNEGGVFVTLEVFHRNFIINIKDTGIGIPKDSIDLIFEEFRQVSEGLGRGFQGTGLGLTICKKYVELLGGQISVKSTPKKGSEFSFQIPLISEENIEDISIEMDENTKSFAVKTKDEQRILNIESKESIEKKKILVVEDDSTSRDVIYLFLKNLYEVSFAEDGEKALKSIDGKQFDLIIMDIN